MGSMFLQMKKVGKSFQSGNRSIEVLQDISMTFKSGATYAIMGVSGVGKSTLMQLLAGIEPPSTGSISVNDVELSSLNEYEKNRFLQHTVGLLFQYPYLINELTVLENCMMPACIISADYINAEKQAQELLTLVEVIHKKDEYPPVLSGGQQTRVVLARALMNRPAFLLADEPTSNLDETTAKQIITLLLTLHRRYKIGLIMCTHDRDVADSMDYVFELSHGKLREI